MTTIELSGPTNILVIEGLTMPDATPFIDDITAAAPEGSTINLAHGLKDAVEFAGDAEVLLGILTERFFAETDRLRWVPSISSGRRTPRRHRVGPAARADPPDPHRDSARPRRLGSSGRHA